MPEKLDKRRRDVVIARTAGRQHGLITTSQLLTIGVSQSAIGDRVASGRLHRIHRGVYGVGQPTLSDEGRWMAAVLACGEGAFLSHHSAAELWGIRRRDRQPPEAGGRGEPSHVHVTVSRSSGMSRRQGITLHRSSTLTADQCSRRDGIPVTTPTRTLADLQPVLSRAEFGAALREAEFLRFPIGDRFSTDGGRTELETRFLSLCRRHRLPKPEVNVKVDRFEVDFLWRDERVIVEVDGWESHRTRSAFEEDRARDAHLTVLGYEVLRFTWRQVTADRATVAETIRRVLRSRSV
jgi:very-short-patch-repair endonuclease